MDALAIDEAKRRLGLFEREEFDDLLVALATAALAVPAARIDARVAVAAALAAGVAMVLAAVAAGRRRTLIARLALDRDAYVLDEVRAFGRRITAQPQRERLARTLSSLAADPDHAGAFDRSRVRAFAPELGAVADELRDPAAAIDPTSMAECRRLLTDGEASPLLNPDVPIVDLRATLLRIDRGVHHVAGFPHPDQESR